MIKSQAFEKLEIDEVVNHIEKTHHLKPHTIVLDTFLELDELDTQALYLTYLSSSEIKLFINKVLNTKVHCAFLPNKECIKAIKSYNLLSDYKAAVKNAFAAKNLSKVDILTANETVVFQSVIFGDVYGLNSTVLPDDSYVKRVKRFFTNLRRVKFSAYTITMQEDNSIDFAATGVLIYEHNLKAAKNSMINEDISLHDGALNAMILSPKSIFSYLYLLFIIYFYQRFSLAKLPKSVGLVKSSQITLASAGQGLDYFVDEVALSAKEVKLQVNKDALQLHMSSQADLKLEGSQAKEELKVQELPKGEYKKLLLKRSLPLFQKAQAEDFKELLTTLRFNAKPSISYTVLMLFSTLIATVGLFLNSGPVIIGAMILAPLMAPIVSLSMGVVRDDAGLIKSSLLTISAGITIALFASAFFTLLMPTLLQTAQIQARMQPNLLDLFVAVFSGVAAAYANAKEEIAKSLAGVAIAVALVPPLAVTGIGIGWLDYEVIKGSFLLFITNLVGITIASSITFVILGYAPIKRAKRGIMYTTVMFLVIAVPLIFAFLDIVSQNMLQQKITQNKQLQLNPKVVEYKILNIEKKADQSVVIELELTVNALLSDEQLQKIKTQFQKSLDKKVWLKVTTKQII